MEYCSQLDYQPDSCTLRNMLIDTKEVDVSYCDLGTDAGCLLGQCLHLLVNLRAFDIANNKISDEATISLAIGMLLSPNLVELVCDGNLFSKICIMILQIICKLRITINKSCKCELILRHFCQY